MADIENITREAFNDLEIWKQAELINDHIKNGISFNKFCKHNTLPESTIRTRLKTNGFTRDKAGLFIFEPLTNQIALEDVKAPKKKPSQEPQEALSLELLLNRIESIEKELEALREANKGINKGDIFTPYESDNHVHQLTTRIYLEIYEKLNKFYNQNKLIPRQTLFNTLLNDALDRYLK